MSAQGHDLITERVVNAAERIEGYDDPDELEDEIMEVKVLAGIDGEIREVVGVVAIGGPHVEVNLTHGTIEGWWGGDHHETHVSNEGVLAGVEERYRRYWEDNVRV